LRKLQTDAKGSLIRYNSASGKYAFADPIYRVFALSSFAKDKTRKSSSIHIDEIQKIIEDIQDILKKQII
jgi:hypothetical protein